MKRVDKLYCKKIKSSIFRLHFIQTFGYTVAVDLSNMALAWALLDLLIILGLGPYYTSARLIFSTLHQGAAAVHPLATCAVTTCYS